MTNKKFKLAAMSLATAVAVSAVGPSASAVTYYLGDGSVTVDKDVDRGAYSYQGEDGSEEHRTYVNEDKAETGDGTIYVKDGNAPTEDVPPSTDNSDNGTEVPTPTDNATQSTDASGNNAENSSDPTELPETEESEPAEPVDLVEQKAEELLAGMTLEEKVGQMFIARCPETDAASKVTQYHLGGYILFARDFTGKTKEEVTAAIQSYQNAAEIPLLIGVDEEGGTVNRVSKNTNLRKTPFASPQELYTAGGWDMIRSDTQEKGQLLQSLGINLNFAPVCDVSQDPQDFIYARSFGQDAEQTAEYVRTVVQTMSQEQMGSVLKHFPGYGNNSDTHTGIAYDERPIERFVNSDFLPFQAGIDAGADMVLVAHNVVSCMDGQVPASISLPVHNILRNELGFDGVIITDDLVMEGVRQFAGDAEIAVRAVQAGNDMLCCTDFEVQVPAVIKAVETGEITEERLNESVLRILKMKIKLGIIADTADAQD